MASKINLFVFLTTLLFCTTINAQGNSAATKLKHPIYGIIVPVPDESLKLEKNISNKKHISIAGLQYTLGTIHHKNIVFINSGIGKANAAITTTRLIRDFQPDLILVSGSSGNINPTLKKGDVVVGKSIINADLGKLTVNGTLFKYNKYLRNPSTHFTLPLEFNLNKNLATLVTHLSDKKSPKIILGRIATSDNLPNPEEQIKILRAGNVDVVEMEGAAIMQACWLFNTPCIVIRGVSNNAEEKITQQDVQFAANNAANVLMQVINY